MSPLIAELELYAYVEIERKGCGRGEGVDFYIYPIDSVERKALLDALKNLVVWYRVVQCLILKNNT
ncbi:MAG: hypothetical protein WB581_06795 [Halobacteriota archaeon]